MLLSDVEVVLCRPEGSGNLGAVCRAMKNHGLVSLSLVAPSPPDVAEVLSRAVGAADVWRRARVFDRLGAAVADCSFVVGTTARRGRKRKVSLRPRELAARLAAMPAGTRAALVFGNERDGLDAAEIAYCNAASHIPASPDFPSLNLSHAVQVYAYELLLALSPAAGAGVKGEWVPLDRAGADALAAEITGILESLGFYRRPGRQEQERFIRDVVCRAGITEREGRYLAEVVGKALRMGLRERGD